MDFFIFFLCIIFIAQVWGLQRNFKIITSLEDFNDREKQVLYKQSLASILSLPFTLIFIMSFAGINVSSPIFGQEISILGLGIIAIFIGIVYISVSSIRNQVSIIRPRGQQEPTKGNTAVIFGVAMFIGVLVMIGAIYFDLFPLNLFIPQ
jgi:hypothetical protein